MTSKIKIILLAGNTLRARAYAQQLSYTANNNIEIEALLYGFTKRNCIDPEIDNKTKKFFTQHNLFIPDLSESIKETLDKNNWQYSEIENTDVNSDDIINELKKFDGDIIVFAGYGGQILKLKHFELGKKYLHMHPGELPMERGSTTIYYSILNGRNCSVTAFYMSEKIDDGINILCKKYNVPYKNVNIDLWYDNVVRADCFIEALEKIISEDTLNNDDQSLSEEFYVIHPILKHIALLSLKKDE